MRDYWLAKLIGSVSEVDSRKKLQKSLYLLSFRKGFPLKFDYFLHYYGPYSRDLVALVDQLDSTDILKEKQYGSAIHSKLTEEGSQILKYYENIPEGQVALKTIEPFLDSFKHLCNEETWVLELASTLAYFYQADQKWETAIELTADFKKVRPDNGKFLQALQLAKELIAMD
jgi:uncharacterized protein YwgA